MTVRLTYYRRYMRDFRDGCYGLTWEQSGFYDAVVDEIYLAGGPVAIDWRIFAKRAKTNAKRANRLLSELISLGKLYVADDGRIGNPRADKEIKAVMKIIEKSDTESAKHTAKHTSILSKKTQQKLRARDSAPNTSTKIYNPSLLVPSSPATTGNGSAVTHGSPGCEGRSPWAPSTEEREMADEKKQELPKTQEERILELKAKANEKFEVTPALLKVLKSKQWLERKP